MAGCLRYSRSPPRLCRPTGSITEPGLNGLAELEKAGRVPSKKPPLVGSGKGRQLCHHLHRPVVADGEAIIAADHDPLGADQANEVEKHTGIVADRVVGKSLEVSRRFMFHLPAFFVNLVASVHSPNQG